MVKLMNMRYPVVRCKSNPSKFAKGTLGLSPRATRNPFQNCALLVLCIACSFIAEGQVADSLRFSDLDIHAAKALIVENEGNSDFILLDTRSRIEFKKDHIAGALFLDYNAEDYWERVKTLDKNKVYLVYCHSGGRSGETVKYMKENGFFEAHNMTGGILAWKRAMYPVVRPGKE